jgi:rod shape-determining protein MreC
MIRFNHYQQGVFFTSANVAVGKIYSVSGSISSYFHLKEANEDLLDRNLALRQEVTRLEDALRNKQIDAAELLSIKDAPLTEYKIYKANVINNSIDKPDNYITIDKGELDGIRPKMGVVGVNGIVGIVYMTSPHYSIVISLLNSKSSINCKILGSDYFGHLQWDYVDSRYSYLEDLPRHAAFELGDTVVTSGYSNVFPGKIIVGTVDDISDSKDGASYVLKVRLATDFGKLNSVRILARTGQEEQEELEEKATMAQ